MKNLVNILNIMICNLIDDNDIIEMTGLCPKVS